MLFLLAQLVLAQSREQSSRRLILLIIGFGLLHRGIMLFQEPSLSDDVYRYIWEGRVILNGYNPFVYAPSAAELEFLRDDIWLGVNHKEISAIYPPTMQALFILVALCGGHFFLIKLVFVVFDTLLCYWIFKYLKDQNKATGWILTYFWHPLVILEISGQGHFETVPVFFLLASLFALSRAQVGRASIALCLSIGAKYLPVVFAPAYMLDVYRRKLSWGKVALGPLILGMSFIPFIELGWTSALTSYGTRWRFNDSGFWLVDSGFQVSGFSAWFCRTILPLVKSTEGQDFGVNESYLLYPAKLAVMAIIASFLLYSLWKQKPLLETVFSFFALFFFFSPVLHPWYLIWLVPLLPLSPRPSWLYLTLAIPLSYEILLRFDGSTETWIENPSIKLLIYLPFLALFAFEKWQSWKTDRQTPGELNNSSPNEVCTEA
jgi:alpha-1,6-mannosyltransferase